MRLFKNYLIIALRSVIRNKTHSIINIAGLALGMACAIIILLWVKQEHTFDCNYKDADRIYRLTPQIEYSGFRKLAVSPAPLAPNVKKENPAIKDFTRIYSEISPVLRVRDKKKREGKTLFVDPAFFKIFSYKVLAGNLNAALNKPYSVVLTQQSALFYFGKTNVIGQKIKIENRFDVTVTAVVKASKENTHIKFDILLPINLLKDEFNFDLESWELYVYMSYIKIAKNATQKTINRITDFFKSYENYNGELLPIQNIRDIHLYSDCDFDYKDNSTPGFVNLFLFIAFIILLIASINFVNLATAKTVKRSKEIGIRKTVGAVREQIVAQFYMEAFVNAGLALFLSLGIAEFLLPAFNHFAEKDIHLLGENIWYLISFLILILFFTVIFSGSYPAILFSSFSTNDALKMNFNSGRGKALFRKSLVIFQFSLSIFLITSSLIINLQVRYMKNKPLKYDKEQLISIAIEGGVANNIDSMLTLLSGCKFIEENTTVYGMPLYYPATTSYKKNENDSVIALNFCDVGYNFFKTFGIKFYKGKAFDSVYTDTLQRLIFNKTAMKTFGLNDDCVGTTFVFQEKECIISGIVEDFYYGSLFKDIEPIVLRFAKGDFTHIYVRAKAGHKKQVMNYLKKAWTKFAPGFPFESATADTTFNSVYDKELKLSDAFTYFSFIAILISCLGLYSFSTFIAEQRTKEIGVRKVLGSSLAKIVVLLSEDYVKWILISAILS